jgi:hypothetical protein
MKLDGFTFRDIYLETADESFDLHNCFDFTGFAFDVPTRTLSLRWIPNQYATVGEHRRILVEFHGVSRFSCEPRDSAMPFAEDTCLSRVWYESTPELDYVFQFMSGFTLRANAERATWRTE